MKGLGNVVAREFRYNLLSWRMVLLMVLLLLAVVGASYGVAEIALMGRTLPNLDRPVTEPGEVMTLVTAFIHYLKCFMNIWKFGSGFFKTNVYYRSNHLYNLTVIFCHLKVF